MNTINPIFVLAGLGFVASALGPIIKAWVKRSKTDNVTIKSERGDQTIVVPRGTSSQKLNEVLEQFLRSYDHPPPR